MAPTGRFRCDAESGFGFGNLVLFQDRNRHLAVTFEVQQPGVFFTDLVALRQQLLPGWVKNGAAKQIPDGPLGLNG